MDIISEYFRYYRKFLLQSWDNVGPQEYVILLVSVGVTGWYLMRKAARL